MDIAKLYEKLRKINRNISDLVSEINYDDYELCDIELDKTNPDQNQLSHEAYYIMYNLVRASSTIEYLAKPVSKTGTIQLNEKGHYITAINFT